MTKKNTTNDVSAPVASAPIRRVCQGPVMPIGGAEDKTGDADDTVLARFLDLAGGDRARIAVVPTASETPEEMGQRSIDVFGKLGAKAVDVVNIARRSDTNGDPVVDVLGAASGIFTTGGAQANPVSLLAGTLAMETIRIRNAEGVVVAGTSAGASIVAAHVMPGGTGLAGNTNSAAARKAMVELVAGFGLLQDVVVDQHFSQRGRMGRLMSTFAGNPGLLGIGLAEDTAVLIDREGTLEVFGSGMATIVDGRNATSDHFERDVGDIRSVIESSLNVLGPGRRFDMDERRPLPLDA